MDWLTIVVLIALGMAPVVCMIATAPEEDIVARLFRGKK